jgi:hypothetical protein
MEVEEVEWLAPNRRKTLAPGKLVSQQTTHIIVSDNPFTPLANLIPEGASQRSHQRQKGLTQYSYKFY